MNAYEELLADLARLSNDPLGFVLWAFPWKEQGSELEKELGPESWQVEVLTAVRDGLPIHEAIRIATASGHGVGKSALVAWLILWAIATKEDTLGVVTANTETQLKTKTWAQLGKWYRLFIARELFKLTATAIFSADPLHERTWRIDMVPWSERNTEAFAGLHNLGKRILVIFDEASAIPDLIWETTEGALTDKSTEIIWGVFGNPTRNSGRFRDCHKGGRFHHRWTCFRVDSRSVRFSNKEQIAEWIHDYGIESDFVKVRVLGEFPSAGVLQFISLELVEASFTIEVVESLYEPLVLGVDVARYGENESVIVARRGLDARSIPLQRFMGLDTVQLSAKVVETYVALRADMAFIDEGGVGAGVVDICRRTNINSQGVQFGTKSDRRGDENSEKYANKRAEMWGLLRYAMGHGLALPPLDALRTQLVGPEYGLNLRDEIQLERKEDMMRRGVPSPDIADAFALTYAYPIGLSPMAVYRQLGVSLMVEHEYDPTAEDRMVA